MRTKVQKWGNSLGVRIPKALAEQASVAEGTSVYLSVEDGEIVLRPVVPRYELAELLDRVRPGNRHEEISTGEPAGREAW
jgi:antitoxin MazE